MIVQLQKIVCVHHETAGGVFHLDAAFTLQPLTVTLSGGQNKTTTH